MPKTKRQNATAVNRNPWDRAKRLTVVRGNDTYPPEPLEDGVNFFVLMLEQIGCETRFSCEGHPAGFYVVFRGGIDTAREVVRCGFLGVEVMPEEDAYRLSLRGNEAGIRENFGEPWSDAHRVRCLRHAAAAWVGAFGELQVT